MNIPWWIWFILIIIAFNIWWKLHGLDIWRRWSCIRFINIYHDTDKRIYQQLSNKWEDRGMCRRCGQRILFDQVNFKEHVVDG